MRSELFRQYDREEWKTFRTDIGDFEPIKGLAELVSLNDRLSQEDVRDVYVPLINYIDVKMRHKIEYDKECDIFLNDIERKHRNGFLRNPFIIGVSGSVAVGKSTSARVVKTLLQEYYVDKNVELITTDGFLYPNEELENRGIMHRKGFPESYDMPKLINFLSEVKTGHGTVSYPQYSHEIYDVLPGEERVIEIPDILIVEGINVFQLPGNSNIYMSDFLDFSLYIDADPLHIKQWFEGRFKLHLELAKDDKLNYYYPMTKWPEEKIENYSNQVWYTVNLLNLVQYIEPTKDRANVILHKSGNHSIDDIYVRKY